jgi:hypothetical protein
MNQARPEALDGTQEWLSKNDGGCITGLIDYVDKNFLALPNRGNIG